MRLSLLHAVPALALLATACVSIDHNVPAASPISAGLPERLTLYADANGHLYPDRWEEQFDRHAIEEQHSLLSAAGRTEEARRRLRDERTRQLDTVAARLRDRGRIFILVHGFNNTHAEARHAFDIVRGRLPLRPSDGVVEFHWDGLSSRDTPGQMAMWFNAVGYSQVAGTQALRGLIARLPDKHIVIVAHSRGASVTLSALSNPSWARGFRRSVEALLGDEFPAPPLPEATGPIDLLFLAPAIGNPDFWTERGRSREACPFRDFPRLRSLHYTVNERDPVLKKHVRGLASRFNATDLGHRLAVGQRIAACYRGRFTMQPHQLSMPRHSFIDYALDGIFPRMVAAAGLTP